RFIERAENIARKLVEPDLQAFLPASQRGRTIEAGCVIDAKAGPLQQLRMLADGWKVPGKLQPVSHSVSRKRRSYGIAYDSHISFSAKFGHKPPPGPQR